MFVQQSCKKDTGFHECTLQHIWDKYNAFGGSPPGTFGGLLKVMEHRGIWRQQAYFYSYFIWLHQGLDPARKQAWKLRNFPDFGMSPSTFKLRVLPLGDALAELIDEIDYSRRRSRAMPLPLPAILSQPHTSPARNHLAPPLPIYPAPPRTGIPSPPNTPNATHLTHPTHRYHPYNHAPFFKYFVTGLVDVFPVYVPAPTRYSLAKLLFQPKYNHCVFKIQLGVNFLGEIILWTGPHLGVVSDITIWEATWADHPFQSWELWLADLGYVGGRGLMTKFKRYAGLPLTRNQQATRPTHVCVRLPLTSPACAPQLFNNVHEHVRNRIENVIARIKVPCCHMSHVCPHP